MSKLCSNRFSFTCQFNQEVTIFPNRICPPFCSHKLLLLSCLGQWEALPSNATFLLVRSSGMHRTRAASGEFYSTGRNSLILLAGPSLRKL